jgi:hypothetical protein
MFFSLPSMDAHHVRRRRRTCSISVLPHARGIDVPAITLLEYHLTAYAHVSAGCRTALFTVINRCTEYVETCKEKVTPFWGIHVNLGETMWTLECC